MSDSYNSSACSSSSAALAQLPVMQASTMRVSVKRPRSPTFEFMHADTASYSHDDYNYEQQQQQQQQQCNDATLMRSGSSGKRVRFKQEVEHIDDTDDTADTANDHDYDDSCSHDMMAQLDVAHDAMDVQQQLHDDDYCDTANSSSSSSSNGTDEVHMQHTVRSNASTKHTLADTTVHSNGDIKSATTSQLSKQHDGMSSSIVNSSSATAVHDAIHVVDRKVVTRLNMSIHDDDTSDTKDTICIQVHNYSIKHTISDSGVNSNINSSNSKGDTINSSDSSNNAENTTKCDDSITVCRQSVADNKQTTVLDSIHASSVDDYTTDTTAMGTCSDDSIKETSLTSTDDTQQLAITNDKHQTATTCSTKQVQAVTVHTTASESVMSILLSRAAKCNNLQLQPQADAVVNDANDNSTITTDATTAAPDSIDSDTKGTVIDTPAEQSETTVDETNIADIIDGTTDVDREQAAANDSIDVAEYSNAVVADANDVQFDISTITANSSTTSTDQAVVTHSKIEFNELEANDISSSNDIQCDETIADYDDTIEQQWDVLDWSSNVMLSTSKQGHMQLSAEYLCAATVIGQVDR
jgi:hypothetical protein